MDIEKIKIFNNHSNNGKTSERYTSQEEQPLSTSTEIKNLNPVQEELNTNDDNIYYYTANDIENNSDNQNSENFDDNEKINLNFKTNNPNIIHKNIFMNYKQKNSNSKNKKNSKSNTNKKFKLKNNTNIPPNKKIHMTKYDYILQPGKKSSGPIEIPPDFEFEENSGKIEYDFPRYDGSQEKKEKIKKLVKRANTKIFNNKKNNDICSNLLKQSIENGNKLSLFPYAKQKEKINKTIDTIGFFNGISYSKTSILSGGNVNLGNHNIMYITRENKRGNKFKNYFWGNNFNNVKGKVTSKAEINL